MASKETGSEKPSDVLEAARSGIQICPGARAPGCSVLGVLTDKPAESWGSTSLEGTRRVSMGGQPTLTGATERNNRRARGSLRVLTDMAGFETWYTLT